MPTLSTDTQKALLQHNSSIVFVIKFGLCEPKSNQISICSVLIWKSCYWCYLGPVVSSSALSENKVVWSEDLSERSWSHGVHGTGLQIDQHRSGHIFASYKTKNDTFTEHLWPSTTMWPYWISKCQQQDNQVSSQAGNITEKYWRQINIHTIQTFKLYVLSCY